MSQSVQYVCPRFKNAHPSLKLAPVTHFLVPGKPDEHLSLFNNAFRTRRNIYDLARLM